jgi:hypothetical protein
LIWKTADVCRSEIGGRTVIFSEDAQKLIALNEAAAIIWQGLEAGFPCDKLADDIDRQAAVSRLLANWARNGFIRRSVAAPARKAPSRPDALPQERDFEIGLARIRLCLGTDVPGAMLWPYFTHFETSRREAQVTLKIHLDTPPSRNTFGVSENPSDAQTIFRFSRGNRILVACSEDKIVPILKNQLTTEVLDHGAYALALHAAALVIDGRLLVITGPPGAGKSILAVGLLRTGLGFAADDLVLLDGDGAARGVPFWPALKEPSWTLLEHFRPDMDIYPVHHRPDGKAVRYLPPDRAISRSRHPVGWIISLSEDGCGLAPLDPLRTFEVLLSGAFLPGNQLSKEGFRALALLVQGAHCFSLGRLPIAEAVSTIQRACQ